MIQVDFIHMNDYAADSCGIRPTDFLLHSVVLHGQQIWFYHFVADGI